MTDDTSMPSETPTNIERLDRRDLLLLLAAAAAAPVLSAQPASAQTPANGIPVPKRVVTGRDASGKSVFKSVGVTPQVITFDSSPGFIFYETYATDQLPRLTGQETDPVLTKRRPFPAVAGSLFRLVVFPPKGPDSTDPLPGYRQFLDELSKKVPGMDRHFERDTPGMHTSDSVDYGIVIRGNMTLELDGGKTVSLGPGDCVVQNGTRHRWVNPSSEPCLMAFVLIGGKRA